MSNLMVSMGKTNKQWFKLNVDDSTKTGLTSGRGIIRNDSGDLVRLSRRSIYGESTNNSA